MNGRLFRFVAICLMAALLAPSMIGAYAIPTTSIIASKGVRSNAAYDYRALSVAHHVSGPQNALVILVDFQDVQHTNSVDSIQKIAISDLNTYYSEVSYGKISITGKLFGWYTLPHTMGYYGNDLKKPGDDDNVGKLVFDAIAELPSGVDPSAFSYLVIVHAGQDQAADQYDKLSGEIWSRCECAVFPKYEAPDPVFVGLKQFTKYIFMSEFNGMGTYAHEWGHMFGLPDLYDTDTEDSYVGYWSLMDSGNWCCYNDAQSTPSYIGGWGAAVLGWLAPSIGDTSVLVSSFDMKPLETPQATAILIPVSSSTYYFVEYRSRLGEDSSLPASGILVYYVNELLDTGRGVLRLLDPKTDNTYAPQDAKNFNSATFNFNDRFQDSAHNVYLAFIGISDSSSAVYSSQPLTSAIAVTSLVQNSVQSDGVYNEVSSVTATLLQGGVPMSTQVIELDLLTSNQWTKVDSTTTNPLGTASFQFALNYPVGQYTFRLAYAGGKGTSVWYTSSVSTFTFDIKPANMVISVPQTTYGIGQTKLTVETTDAHAKPLSNVLVTIFVNNMRQAFGKTDSNGQITFTIQSGTFDFAARSVTVKAELANYQSTQGSGTVTVYPIWFLAIVLALIAAIPIAVWRLRRR